MKTDKQLKNKVLNTEHYAVEIKETHEGVIIDIFHRHGDLINSYTYWNDDTEDDFTKKSIQKVAEEHGLTEEYIRNNIKEFQNEL